jgi:4-aminobutyrate aminotransferase
MGGENQLPERYREAISETEQILLYPFVMESQDGSIMRTPSGEEAIDFFAAWAVGSTGYRHPTVLEKLEGQLEKGYTNSPLTIPHEPVVELAERLQNRLPGDFPTKAWIGHSGSDAGDLVARALPAIGTGDTVVTFEGSYHGGLQGSASISGHSAQATAARTDRVVTLDFPYPYRAEPSPEAERDAVLEAAKETFETREVAGLITEPLQSDGGIRVPPDGFLEGLADLCADHDAYFVVDEVKAGLGRTGEFFAFEHANVVPDAVMLGKPLGSGLPVSALVGRAELIDYEPATHMMTTAGAPLCAAAGLATLDVIEAEALPNRAARVGERLRESLDNATAELAIVGDVRGRGLMQGVELVDPETNAPDPELTAKAAFRARELGLLVAYVGVASNVLELTPPLTIDEHLVDEGVDRLARAIEDAADGAVGEARLER